MQSYQLGIALTLESERVFEELTKEELIKALEDRLSDLKKVEESELREAFEVLDHFIEESSEGSKCPACGSDEVSYGGSLEVDGNKVTQDVECGACEYTRVDTYKLEERCSK